MVHECMIKNSWIIWNKTIQERELEQNMTRMGCQFYLRECYLKIMYIMEWECATRNINRVVQTKRVDNGTFVEDSDDSSS